MIECNCLKAENTNLTIRKTFEFIQQFQVSSSGSILSTTLTLNINLLETQVSGIIQDRVSATNTVTGFISAVTNTNVVIIAKSETADKFSEYVVEYSSIIQIASDSVVLNFDLYLNYMNSLPMICKNEKDQYSEMLRHIESFLNRNDLIGYQGIQLIFNSVKSRLISFGELTLVKNLIIVGDLYIIPLNYIGGFTLIPNCESEEIIKEEEK